jgi:hypothetical protein
VFYDDKLYDEPEKKPPQRQKTEVQVEMIDNDVQVTSPLPTKDSSFSIVIIGTFTRNEYIEMVKNEKDQLYHFLDYIPPGLHHYKIIYLRNKSYNDQKILVETTLNVKMRDKEIKPQMDKELVLSPEKKQVCKFIHDRSVFADFRMDTAHVFKTCFENDQKYIKLYRFIPKDEEVIKFNLINLLERKSFRSSYQRMETHP